MSLPLTIVHVPHGTDHPYLAGAEERSPRDPSGGDMVSVGFLTKPGGAARAVRLDWTRNGIAQTPVHGRALALQQDHDRWLVELGVLEAGDRLEYRMAAEGEGECTESPLYRFGVRRVRILSGFGAMTKRADGVSVVALDAEGRAGPTLTLRAAGADWVQIALGGEAAPGPLATQPIQWATGSAALTVETNGRITLTTDSAVIPMRLRWVEEADGALVAVDLSGDLEDGEAIVGLGERFDALDQRGRAPGVVVYEQYKNQGDRTYLPVPFFCSSRGYACLVEGSAPVAYDFGRTVPDRWRSRADVGATGVLAVDFMAGSPLLCVQALTALTGRPAMPPPAWAFGLWMSSNEWNTQARVEHEVAQTQHYGIPATALVIEAWSDETTFYIWNGAQYAPVAGEQPLQLANFTFPADGPWPDPKGVTDALHALGIRLVLWQIPALKHIEDAHAQHDADTHYALEHDFVLRMENGDAYRNPAFWFKSALIPDFTSAAATAWWMEKRAYLLDEMAIDGFKTDGGEHLQGREIVASDGRRGNELVNAFPTLYVGAYHRFAQQRRGAEAMTFSRAGHTGVGAFPAHWAGDENSTWEAFRRSLVAGLSAGLSGVPFWGWDIAGFSEALPAAELYLRAAAMAAFCPIMQYHSEYRAPDEPCKDRTPWNIQAHTGDPRVIPLFRRFACLRMNLLPYLVREAAHSAATGEPMLRALLLDNPDDSQVWHIADQYRLGRDLLIAPVVEDGAARRRLYLPQGRWFDLWNGESQQGGCWIEVDAPLDTIPVFVRAGAVLPLNLGNEMGLGADVGNALAPALLTLFVYPSGASEAVVVFNGEALMVRVDATASGVRVELPALPVPCSVVLPDGQRIVVDASEQVQTINFT